MLAKKGLLVNKKEPFKALFKIIQIYPDGIFLKKKNTRSDGSDRRRYLAQRKPVNVREYEGE